MSFACKTLCGHNLHRPHFTCLFCRMRRMYYGKMNMNKFLYYAPLKIVVPKDCTTYILFIDDQQSYPKIKRVIMKMLLTICEWLAN